MPSATQRPSLEHGSWVLQMSNLSELFCGTIRFDESFAGGGIFGIAPILASRCKVPKSYKDIKNNPNNSLPGFLSILVTFLAVSSARNPNFLLNSIDWDGNASK